MYSGSVILDRTHETIGADRVSIRTVKNIANIRFNVPKDIKIRSKYYIIFPDGNVKEYPFESKYIASDTFLLSGSSITIPLPLTQDGTYILEIVQQDGIAYANIPLRRGNVWSILEPYTEYEAQTIRKNKNTVLYGTLSAINLLRESLVRKEVALDTDLTKLAQAKVDDMMARNYEAHRDPDGNYID